MQDRLLGLPHHASGPQINYQSFCCTISQGANICMQEKHRDLLSRFNSEPRQLKKVISFPTSTTKSSTRMRGQSSKLRSLCVLLQSCLQDIGMIAEWLAVAVNVRIHQSLSMPPTITPHTPFIHAPTKN